MAVRAMSSEDQAAWRALIEKIISGKSVTLNQQQKQAILNLNARYWRGLSGARRGGATTRKPDDQVSPAALRMRKSREKSANSQSPDKTKRKARKS